MNADCRAVPDVVLVMGTSLAIPSVQSFLRELKATAPTGTFILVNSEAPKHGMNEVFDYHLQGAVSHWASALYLALSARRPAAQEAAEGSVNIRERGEIITTTNNQSASGTSSEAETGTCKTAIKQHNGV